MLKTRNQMMGFITDDVREIEWRQYVGEVERLAMMHSIFSDDELVSCMGATRITAMFADRADIILTLQEAGWCFADVVARLT